MKKFLLALLSLGSAAAVNAQSFTTQADTIYATVTGGVDANIYNKITNNTSAPFPVNWKYVSDNLPSNWKTSPSVFGVCDNYNCYNNNLVFSGAVHTSNNYNPGVSGDFHLQLNIAGSASSGSYYLTLNLDGGGSSKNITFVLNKFPTAINNVSAKNTEVSLYPNPAHGTLNVNFDDDAGVKNIAVYNLIGKEVANYKVNGSSAQLDIDNIPAGIYLLRLLDAQGHVLATRKFTHQ
jgi:hypothetical protein